MNLTVDFETRSRADLPRVGARRYADDPSTEVLCLAVKVDDQPPKLWVPTQWRGLATRDKLLLIDTPEIEQLCAKADTISAWNVEFELAIWQYVFSKICPLPALSKFRCAASKAAMHALPRSLDECGAALRAPIRKDRDGYAPMMRLCKPDKLGAWREAPEDLVALFRYCLQDADAEHGIDKLLRDLPPKELEIWQLDQRINARGLHVDTAAAATMIEMTQAHTERLLSEFKTLVDFSPRQVAKLKSYLETVEIMTLEGVTKNTVKELLAGTSIAATSRRLLEIRQSVAKASVAKYAALIARAHGDSRIRSYLMYHGASTGRWTGKGFQPQNLPREAVSDPDTLFRVAALGPQAVEALYGDPMIAASRAVRSVIDAPEGKELICADYNAIESRELNWEANEEWALEAYRKFDADHDLSKEMYRLNAHLIYNVKPEDATKDQRQIGKYAELALGYQGGVKAFIKIATSYGVKEMPPETELEHIKFAWREAHPNVVSLWHRVEAAAKAAIREPGAVFIVNRLSFRVYSRFLCLRLASGRVLYYYDPAIVAKELPWGDMGEGITFMGVDGALGSPTYGQWARIDTYGGRLVENVVQGTCRDICAQGMLNVEAAGYPVVLSVHDEVVSEIPKGYGSVEEYESLLCRQEPWAKGLPLTAEGWRGTRYKK